MNALNLKITGDTKKKGRKREAKEDFSSFYAHHEACKSVLDSLTNAPSMESQISTLKSIISSIKIENNSEASSVINLCLDLIWLLNSKSPLRAAILRHLMALQSPMKVVVGEHLLKFIEIKSLSDDHSIEYITQYLTFLMAWLENSTETPFPLEKVASVVTSYLGASLKSIVSDFSVETAPTAKLQVIEALHSNVRCLISIFQKANCKPPPQLQELILTLLKDDQLPLDTRSNCGILHVLYCVALDPHFQGDKMIDDTCTPDDFQSLLCLCGGLLNILSGEDLAKIVVSHHEERTLLNYLLHKIVQVEESNPADCTLVLSASRCILLVTKCVVATPQLLSKSMLSTILNFVWVHLEHYMDAVRHLASSSLSNVVSAGKKLDDKFVFDVILSEVTLMASDRRSKHAAISALIGNLPIQNLLMKCPGLVEALLESAKISPAVNHAIGSYEALLAQHFKEKTSMEEWYDRWVNPLISALGDRPNAAFDHILGTIVRLDPSVILYIARLQSSNPDRLTGIFLICLRIGRKLGVLKDDDDDSKWKGVLDYDWLAKHVYHSNGDVRIACFALITETQKLSEEFSLRELDIVKLFLNFNINNHCAAERQKTLAYCKKFLSRFKLGFDSCERVIEKQDKKPANATTKDISAFKMRMEAYNEFKNWLVQFCIDNLFPGANFARRGSALNLLTLCNEYGFWTGGCHSESNCAVLLRCFLDSYEENKNLAKKLLTEVSLEVLRFDVPEYLSWYIDSSARLAASIRPVDSQSAAYFVSLLASFPSVGSLILSLYADLVNSSAGSDVSKVPDLTRYVCVVVLLGKLKRELDVAQESLLKAASSGPLYGQLFVLRHILKDADFDSIVNSEEWKAIIQEVITVAYECNRVVASVVNSSSPEGHLPMDFDYDISVIEPKEDVPKVTAQMVLLCSWRTVKEVSLLLGDLSETVPISTGGGPGLITEKQILDVGEHLSTLLAETKHRGAFEQAYVGFCKLASRLWRYPKGNLHELPSRWLDEILEEISNNQNLSATRRSAGIPFRIQGLVCTELEVGGGKCFHRGIKILLKLASDPNNSVETKCHALNILRALYRHTLLGEMVSPYVAEGLTIAIQGFNASTWAMPDKLTALQYHGLDFREETRRLTEGDTRIAIQALAKCEPGIKLIRFQMLISNLERNSSTLLLSALMTRVFGVPRSRSENLCWKNKMTGRIFFQRYPSLFGVLLNHLETASQKSLYPATYPALLILGRLYPSSLEGTDSNLQLSKYVPLVFKCSGSNILKTRTLAASAMVALITPNLFVSHIEGVFNALAGSLSENFTHGLLLQVLKLFRASSDLPVHVKDSVVDNIEIWLTHVIQLLVSSKRSSVTKTTCVSILLHWITHYFKHIPSDCLQTIKSCIVGQISSSDTCPSQFGNSVFLLYSATLLLTIDYYRQKLDHIVESLIILLKHENYDVRNVTLDFLRCVLQDSKCFCLKVDDASNIQFRSSDFKEQLRELVVTSDEIAVAVVSSLESYCHHEDTVAVLSVIRYVPKGFELLKSKNSSIIQYFGEICRGRSDGLGCLAFECISSSLSHSGVDELKPAEIDRLCQLLDLYSLPDCENACRSGVAAFLAVHFDNLVAIGSSYNNLIIWTSILRLLNDDDCDIRETLAEAFSPNTVPLVAVEKLIEKLIDSNVVDNEIKSCLLLQWSLWDCNLENQDDDESIDRVFDKGDMNTYLEDLTVTSIASRHLTSFMENHPEVVTKELPGFCFSWVTNESQLPLSGSTLKDIAVSAKTQIELCSSSLASLSPHSGPFSSIFKRTFGHHKILDAPV